MKKTIFLITICLLIFQENFGQNPIYKFSGIKAHLFYNKNNDFSDKKVVGTISENIIDNEEFILWNTVIGEGSAKGPSKQTLLVFYITGKEGTDEKRTLKIECKSGGKIILKQETELSSYSQNPNYCYAVLVNDTGCEKLEIYAEIFNSETKKTEDKISKTIDFQCGE